MPRTLYSTKDSFKKILAWGQNTVDQWYHPVSRPDFTQLHSVKAGDVIQHIIDGVSNDVKVEKVGEIYEYPLMKHIHGDFGMRADRVILVKRV
jgi:hypothetical protein